MTFAREEAVVVLGSSRNEGNTRAAVALVLGEGALEIVDLAELKIAFFDYRHANSNDDFLPLAERLMAKPPWIMATPVYWYTMSAQMKVFVDRLSDLITVRKDLGRLLGGKSLAVIASGTDSDLPEGFEAPFRLTCKYLGMGYLGSKYVQCVKDGNPRVAADTGPGAPWIA